MKRGKTISLLQRQTNRRFALHKRMTYRITHLLTSCRLHYSQLLPTFLSTPHLLPLLIQPQNLLAHFLLHACAQQIGLRWRVPVLLRFSSTYLLPLFPFLPDFHQFDVIAIQAKLGSGVLNRNHDLLAWATVLEDVRSTGARLFGSWSFGDGCAS